MINYEYCSIFRGINETGDEFIAEMNALGLDAWELVSVVPPNEEYLMSAYFKRKI